MQLFHSKWEFAQALRMLRLYEETNSFLSEQDGREYNELKDRIRYHRENLPIGIFARNYEKKQNEDDTSNT